jgi:hypothetical protein
MWRNETYNKIKAHSALLMGVGVLIGVGLDSAILRPIRDPMYAKEPELPAYRQIQNLPFACSSDPGDKERAPLDDFPEAISATFKLQTRSFSAPKAEDRRNLADCC